MFRKEIYLFPLYILVLKIGFLYIFALEKTTTKTRYPLPKERHYVALNDLKKFPYFKLPNRKHTDMYYQTLKMKFKE